VKPLLSRGFTRHTARNFGLDDGATLVDGRGRVAGSWSGSVARRMAHLRERGFDGARLPSGIDELGRAVVTYLPGGDCRKSAPLAGMDSQ